MAISSTEGNIGWNSSWSQRGWEAEVLGDPLEGVSFKPTDDWKQDRKEAFKACGSVHEAVRWERAMGVWESPQLWDDLRFHSGGWPTDLSPRWGLLPKISPSKMHARDQTEAHCRLHDHLLANPPWCPGDPRPWGWMTMMSLTVSDFFKASMCRTTQQSPWLMTFKYN